MFPEVNSIVEFFFKNPTKSVHLRELARQTGFSPAGARKVLKKLAKQGFILESKSKVVVNYKANLDSLDWLPQKRAYNFYALYACGLVQALRDAYHEPEAIVLFGSYARGEDVEQSDVDIAIVASVDKSIDLSKYENVLARKINILEVDVKKAKKEFLNNLANGIVLQGYLTLL